MRYYVSLMILLLSTATYAIGLTPTEQQLRHTIVQSSQQQLALLAKLVNINSGTTNPAGVRKVGKIMQAEFTRLGFKTRWAQEPQSMHHAGTLFAERKGKSGKRILLIGHLDTVFAPTPPLQHFVLRKNTAKGPGVLDDKGGMVVILYALKALAHEKSLNDVTITVALMGDEEESGKPTSISRKPLRDVALHSDIALDFEEAVTLNTGTIARRGIGAWTIDVTGNQAHSATIFQKDVGAGAIFELARILDTMRNQLVGEKDITFNPGLLSGGTTVSFNEKTFQASAFGKTNIVAKAASVKGDYRFLTDAEKKSLQDKMTAIVHQSLPGTHATITFQDGIPAMPPTDANLALLNQYSNVSVDLGQNAIKPLDPGMRGAGDISHIASIVPANLAGLGPMGVGSHSTSEAVELDTLPIQTERAAVLIYRLTR